MDDIVERVKEANRIEDVIEEMGYPLQRKRGKYIRGARDDCNSLVINTRNQTYTWNSKNEIQEDAIGWVMLRNGWDFKAALEWLCRRAHLPEPKWSKEDQGRRELRRKREVIFGLAQAAMQRWLWSDQEALEYARSRGWTDETIREAGLGFSGRRSAATLDDLRGDFSLHEIDPECPETVSIIGYQGDVKKWAAKWEIEAMEISNWVEWKRVPGIVGQTRLVYPHFVNGRIQTFSARNILGAEINTEGREVKSYNLPVVLVGERKSYFNHVYSARSEECVVIEGQADAITLAQWDIPAVALLGTAYQDKEKLLEELRKRHERLYLGLDADEAGEIALRGRNNDWPLSKMFGPMARVVRWPESEGPEGKTGKDANDWLRWGMAKEGLIDYQETDEKTREEERELISDEIPEKLAAEAAADIQGEGGAGGDIAELSEEELRKLAEVNISRTSSKEIDPSIKETEDHSQNAIDEEISEVQEKKIKDLVKRQIEKIRILLNHSPTFAEEVANWAGQIKGAEGDAAFKVAFELIAQMDKVDRAKYKGSLIAKLGIGVREFGDILKAAGKELEESPLKTIETLGGFIKGWLLEFIYDSENDEGKLAYRDPDRKIGTAEYVDIEGIRYVPRGSSNFIRDGGVLFASGIGSLKPTRELVSIVEMFINQHYLLESKHLSRIIAYYVMLTWVYDAFNALPYLRAMGEPGAGKSELMRRVGYLCYRMMAASGANSAASFFRATETYRGTVFIDEADLHDGGDMSNDLVKFLNLGAMKGNPIWRLEEIMTDNGKNYEVATFSTFCPKLIAMRKEFRDDAVGSRSLTIKLMPREPIELKARGIRLYIDDEFREKARVIRNMLLRWRLEMWEPEIEVTEEHMDLEVSSRLNQVTMPLKALAKDDPSLQDEIVKFLREYNREMVLTRSMTLAARIVEAMWKIFKLQSYRDKYLTATADGEGWSMMIGDVAKVANEIMDEMNDLGEEGEEESEDTKKKRKKDRLTARGVGSLIRNELQLQVRERQGKGFPVYWDEIKMQALGKRYGIDYESTWADSTEKASPSGAQSKEKNVAKQEEIPF